MNRMIFLLDYMPLIVTYRNFMRMVYPSSFLFYQDQIKFQLKYAIDRTENEESVLDYFDSLSIDDDPFPFISITERMEKIISQFILSRTNTPIYYFESAWKIQSNPTTLELKRGYTH